jgi:hypothetical protein
MGPAESLVERAWARAAERAAALDRGERRAAGIVATPPRLARFVASELVRRAGADASFVDPAVGTGLFPAALIEAGARGPILGIDLDPAALEASGALFGDRVALRHANALASLDLDPRLAADAPGPLVVLGNPPWAGKSRSRGLAASDALVAGFDRDEHGRSLGEKKKGVLSDDYVRFVAWALALVARRRDGGAVGLVTNASFLDGPVHRGMRRALTEALPALDVIDLGGSALVARAAGVVDHNLFGVRPAAAVLIGSRGLGAAAGTRVQRLTGTAEQKYAALAALAPAPVLPERPHFAFRAAPAVPRWYRAAPSLEAWLPFHREGVQTNRDAVCIAPSPEALRVQLEAVVAGTVPLAARAHFDPARARRALGDELARGLAPVRLAYRPFDERWLHPGPSICHRPRPELLRAVAASRLVLVSAQKDRGHLPFRHLVLARAVPDNCLLSPRSSCRARGFPSHDPEGAENLGAEVRAALEDRLGRRPSIEEVLHYLAAHLGSAGWTERLDDVLKSELPRVPMPRDAAHFERLARAGEALEAAFAGESSGAALVWVGHHRARSDALAVARAELERVHAGLGPQPE